MRPSGRKPEEMRPVRFTRHYTRYAEGSVLVEFGETRVLCNATLESRVPPFLKGKGRGWVTAEYGMLPRSTHERMQRDSGRAKPNGRSLEIQRLIGRSLRAVVDLEALGERQIIVDCDVIQADGGTRTAAISGGYIALQDAVAFALRKGWLKKDPLHGQVAAVSVGIFQGEPVLDLDYKEDSQAETDLNLVMNEAGGLIEIQGTAEGHAFHKHELDTMLELGSMGIRHIVEQQIAARR